MRDFYPPGTPISDSERKAFRGVPKFYFELLLLCALGRVGEASKFVQMEARTSFTQKEIDARKKEIFEFGEDDLLKRCLEAGVEKYFGLQPKTRITNS